jgi:hypothetical protein
MSVESALHQVRLERTELMQLRAKQAELWKAYLDTKKRIVAKQKYISQLVLIAEQESQRNTEG